MFGMFFGFGSLFFLLWLIYIIIWAGVLIDILKSDFRGGSDKIVWLLVVFFLPLIGLILYFLIGKSQKVEMPGKNGGEHMPR